MTGSVPPRTPDEEDPFVLNRVPDAELDVSVPFELEVSEWDLDAPAEGAGGESWGSAGDYGLE